MILTVELSLPATDPAVPQVRAVEAGQKDWKFTVEQPDGELFYRTKLSGSLVISGADYAWLYGQWERFPCCVEVAVNIFTPACDGDDDQLFWPGYFLMTAVRWDHTACTATVREVLPRDAYDALYRIWEKPINMLTPSSIGGTRILVPFVATYPDYLTFQPNAQGQLVKTLPDGNAQGTGAGGQEHRYNQAMELIPSLSRLLLDSGFYTPAKNLWPVTSEFYESAVNPVTKRKNLQWIIMAGSDAKRPASVTPAVNMVVTLKEMLEGLRGLHNVYYLIDPDSGKLRLEHYSWFAEQTYAPTNRVTLNLLKFPDALAAANNESTDLERLFGIEELKIENNTGSERKEFATGSVRYDDGCTVRDDKGVVQVNTISVSRFFTDLEAGFKNPDSVPDDSIFLAELMPPKSYGAVQTGLPLLARAFEVKAYKDYTETVGLGNNGYQSAAMLFIDYHRHGRSFSAGVVNGVKQKDGSYADGVRMSMLSTIPTRRQESIKIPVCCADLPLRLDGYVRTNRFPLATFDKGSFDPATDTLEFDVVADSRCQASQVVITPADPGEDCAPKGTFLSIRTEQTYCDDQKTIVMSSQDIFTYTDGECGTYEEYGPITGVGGC
jgi:hypothetical protein